MTNYDYLVVGQGIAGTMLVHFLQKRDKRILVADVFNPSSASNVAAGLCNPITGKRLVKTWKADEIFPFAETTYREMEQILGEKFWYRKNIVRVITGREGTNLYNHKISSEEFSKYILPLKQFKQNGIKLQDAFEIAGSGYLDMAALIHTYRRKLLKEYKVDEWLLTTDELKMEAGGVIWKDRRFGKVIFCEGYKAVDNPLFSWLPFVLAKGEVLIIASKELQLDQVLSKDIFILPIGNNLFKVGSTYQWDKLNENPTEEGKAWLIQKLDHLLDCNYTIVNHHAGIRPTVKDRKPFLGMHPRYPQVGIFNGLGAKGASLAPYFANHFVEFLEDGKVLNREVDIGRFGKV